VIANIKQIKASLSSIGYNSIAVDSGKWAVVGQRLADVEGGV